MVVPISPGIKQKALSMTIVLYFSYLICNYFSPDSLPSSPTGLLPVPPTHTRNSPTFHLEVSSSTYPCGSLLHLFQFLVQISFIHEMFPDQINFDCTPPPTHSLSPLFLLCLKQSSPVKVLYILLSYFTYYLTPILEYKLHEGVHFLSFFSS